MRAYPTNSPAAAGRLLALTMISDGNVAASEFEAIDRSQILEYVDLRDHEFDRVLHDLCNDLLLMAQHGSVQIDPELIDHLLDEIRAPELRRKLLQAMWCLANADDWLADAEAVVLNRASIKWGAEANFAAA